MQSEFESQTASEPCAFEAVVHSGALQLSALSVEDFDGS